MQRIIVFISLILSFGLTAQISSIRVVQTANRYLNLNWTVNSSNITTGIYASYNCSDATQKYIVTPSWVNDLNHPNKTSMPYKWGGFSSISQFETGLANGKYAGDKQTRQPGNNHLYYCGSPAAEGVDCSGFTSRCHELNQHYSTGMMDTSSLFGHYANYNNIQPGDIANKPHSHVRLVVKVNANGTINTIEAGSGGGKWRVFAATYTIASLSNYGYKPQYLRNMTHDDVNTTIDYAGQIIHDGVGGGSGNADQIANSGEQINLDIKLYNSGAGSIHNITAVLSTTDSDINITNNQVNWGEIAANQTKTGTHYSFKVSNTCPTKNITFRLNISANEGSWEDIFTISVQQSNSNIKEKLKNQIILFPNPTNDIITIKNTSTIEISQIIIFDINGKMLKQKQGDINRINMNEFKSGFYFIRILLQDERILNYKIIKE